MKPPGLALPAFLVALAPVLLTSCSSGPDRRAMMEEARHSVPPMSAQDTFFEGKVVAHLALSTGGREEAAAEGGESGGGRRSGGGGGRHGGGRHRGGGESGGAADDSSGGGELAQQARHNESIMPAVFLRLRLENPSATALVIEVRDLNSELGDFAVRPDTLTIGPGQTAEPDGMQSLLGVDTFALPVTLTLRMGGQTETKILTLKPAAPPPGSTPPPPGA